MKNLFLAGIIDSRWSGDPWVCVLKQVTSTGSKVLLWISSAY